MPTGICGVSSGSSLSPGALSPEVTSGAATSLATQLPNDASLSHLARRPAAGYRSNTCAPGAVAPSWSDYMCGCRSAQSDRTDKHPVLSSGGLGSGVSCRRSRRSYVTRLIHGLQRWPNFTPSDVGMDACDMPALPGVEN